MTERALNRTGRTSRRAAWTIGVPALLGCAAFAIWPISRPEIESTRIDTTAPVEPKQLAALNTAAFRIPIWVADPTPVAPVAPLAAVPPPPLKLQLLAIVKDGDLYRAAVYDPDSDKLLVVAAGERIGARTVTTVTKGSVTLRDETGLRTLALKDAKGGGGGGETP